MTTLEQLTEVNTAITAILDGAQEYQSGTRRVRRAELKTLLDERKRLEAQLASETGADVAVVSLGQR